jgi:hypothetical protein
MFPSFGGERRATHATGIDSDRAGVALRWCDWHQAIHLYAKPCSRSVAAEQFETKLIVCVAEEDLLAPVSSLRDVVGRTFDGDPLNSRHKMDSTDYSVDH